MNHRIRVLIIDSDATARGSLSRALQLDRELEVVGALGNGRVAQAQINELQPNVVLLDIAPDGEGLKVLAAIREVHLTLPVIIFSALTQRGSQMTLDALQLGATDYLPKPVVQAQLEGCIATGLIPKIKRHTGRRTAPAASVPGSSRDLAHARGASADDGVAPPRLQLHSAEIVVLAASTGGPAALARVLADLPPVLAIPLIVVQHMGSAFTGGLVDRLARQSGRKLREVISAQSLDAGAVWLATGGRHTVISRRGVAVHVTPYDGPPENACCPSADVLLRSAVEVYGGRCLAVVLTGLGNDGLAGCRAIREAGGQVIVQDQSTSIAWGMPGQVAAAGLADVVVPLSDIAREICLRTRTARERLSQ